MKGKENPEETHEDQTEENKMKHRIFTLTEKAVLNGMEWSKSEGSVDVDIE